MREGRDGLEGGRCAAGVRAAAQPSQKTAEGSHNDL